MDCEMPEMDGYEATRQIREWRNFPDEKLRIKGYIPIIAMTAHALPGNKEKCFAAGMDYFLSKPMAPDGLAIILDKFLKNRAAPCVSDTGP